MSTQIAAPSSSVGKTKGKSGFTHVKPITCAIQMGQWEERKSVLESDCHSNAPGGCFWALCW